MTLANQLEWYASWIKLAFRSLSTSSSMTLTSQEWSFSSSIRLACNLDPHSIYEWWPLMGSLACLIPSKQKYRYYTIRLQKLILFSSSKRALIYTNLDGSSFLNGKETTHLDGLPLFSGSFWSSYLAVSVSLAFCTLVAIIKHCRASCWSLRILLTPFLIKKWTRRHQVETITSSWFNHGHSRITLYAESTQTTINVSWTILY